MKGFIRVWIIGIFLALALTPFIFATGEAMNLSNPGVKSLYSDWIYNGDSIDANGKIIEMTAGSSGDSVYFKSDTFAKLVRIDDCKIEETFGLCVDDISDTKPRRKSYVRIYELRSYVIINKTLSTNSPFPGEEVEMIVRATNSGAVTINVLDMEDSFPNEIELLDVSYPCKKSGNMAFYNGKLGPGDYVQCTYELRPKDMISLTQKTHLNYFDGIDNIDTYVGETLIDVDLYMTASMKFNTTTPTVKDPVRLNITFENNYENDTLDLIDLDISIPDEFQVTSTDEAFTKNKDTYVLNKKYSIQNKISFLFYLYPKFTGDYVVSARGTYEISNIEKTFELKKTLTADIKSLSISWDKNKTTRESHEDEKITVWITNNNTNTRYDNIKVDFKNNGTFYLSGVDIQELLPGKSRKVIDTSFMVPDVKTSKKYDISMNFSYETEFGEEFTSTITKELVAIPIPAMTMTQSVSVPSLFPGNITQISLKIKNNRRVNLEDVKVSDDIQGLEKIGKNSLLIETFPANSEITTYTYHIIAPEVSARTTFNITSYVKYQRAGFNISENKTIPIIVKLKDEETKAKDGSIDIDRTFVKTTASLREYMPATYEIYNNGSISLVHISLSFPIQYEFDTVERQSYFIPSLGEGEKIVLPDFVSYRPKLNGTLYLLPEEVTFMDADGNEYSTKTKNTTLTISKDFEFNTGAVLVNITSPKSTFTGTPTLFNITLQNIGSEPVSGKLDDGSRDWDTTVSAETKKLIQYYVTYDTAGTFDVTPASFSYVIDGKEHFTKSKARTIEVMEASIETDTTDITNRSEIENRSSRDEAKNTSQNNQTTTDKEDSVKKKGFFSKMIEYFVSFFR